LRLHYSCPNCGTDVDNTLVNCPKCFRPLDWPTLSPGEVRRLAREARAYREVRARKESPDAIEYEEGKKELKRQSPWSLGCLFPVALLLLIAGVVLIFLLWVD